MPFYIEDGKNNQQITQQEFADIIGISAEKIKKIEKSPVFEVLLSKTKPDKLNGGVTAPAGIQQKPTIRVKHNGRTIKLRWAEGEPVPDAKNERISHWEPKRITFYDQLEIVTDLEKALFMYAMPVCASTPLQEQIEDAHYMYLDKEEKASKIIADGTLMGKAMVMITGAEKDGGLSDKDVLLTAKGIYAQNRELKTIPNPSAKNKTIIEIKADLMQMVTRDNGKYAKLFVDSVDSSLNEFYGMVLDSVDRGIFKVITNGAGSREWRWAHGPMNTEFICTIEPGHNDFDALKSTIEVDPNKYYSTVIKANQEMSGKETLANFIAAKKSEKPTGSLIDAPKIDNEQEGGDGGSGSDDDKDDGINGDNLPDVPTSFDDVRTYMATLNEGKNPANNILSVLWNLIKDKKVTPLNLEAEAKKALGKE